MPDEFIDYVMELLGPFGTVRTRAMFGGYGVYLDGLMFAIVSEDTLYLKADEMNRVEFEHAGCERFGYARKGSRTTLNFFRAPDDAMDSPGQMLPWARTAYAAALRTNAKKLAAAKGVPQRPAAPSATRAGKKAAKRKSAHPRPAGALKRRKRSG
jgi:DNA transformation protein